MQSIRGSPELTQQNYEQRLGEQPSRATNIVSNMSQQMHETMEYLSVGACRNPTNEADDWELDCKADVVDDSEQVRSVPSATLTPLPNLLAPTSANVPPL